VISRREFLACGIAVVAARSSAEGQQAITVPRLGVLIPGAPPLERVPHWEGFRQGLRDLRYVEGQTILLEYRWAEGKPERYPDLVADLLRLPVDVLVPMSMAALPAIRRATTTVPVVAVSMGDPVGDGFAKSLARPGGNITGLTLANNELVAKRVQLLKEAVPAAIRMTLLRNPRPGATGAAVYQAAADSLGVQLQVLEVRDAAEFEPAFQTMVRSGAQALILAQDPLFSFERQQIATLALKRRLPTISGETGFAEAGGLMTYGASIHDNFRRAAAYVDKILKGARPGDLPIEQPTKFELVVSLKTATALGLTLPPSILVRADRVLQ
jgi:putative ABC transport system substrate-binding protein